VQLSHTICRSARLARDARFDGKFFIGVHSTGIYCRPICPAPSPKEQNVEYYPSAAAAAEAGLRPCLRCRPECSPGTPAWLGSSVTVSRALRLIAEGALEEDGVDTLAERLGIGSRHMRRLFLEHLGATPVAVAQTRRLLAAKKLIDETSLPLTEIAIAAGFGSIRRFNAAFLETWGRCPREMRRTRGKVSAGGPSTLELRYRPPFDWAALLGFLAGRAIGGVECVDGDVYRRTMMTSHGPGWIEARPAKATALTLSVYCPDSSDLLTIASRVRRLFDLDADPQVIAGHLRPDPLLAPLLKARPGLRVPGAWDGFELGVRTILGQQVSVAGASTLAARLVQKLGQPVAFDVAGLTHTFPSPAEFADADLAVGLPAARAEAIRHFARAVASGHITFDAAVDSGELQEKLCSLAGIGPWTAQYIAMRALSDPDAFPAGDLVLLRAAGEKKSVALEQRAEAWQPWRAYAAMHIWQGVKDGKLSELHVDEKSRRKTVAGGG
jgi:AraC family transcriptional regulator of adaptative response / DNA-3-methyladenine glycosylase II